MQIVSTILIRPFKNTVLNFTLDFKKHSDEKSVTNQTSIVVNSISCRKTINRLWVNPIVILGIKLTDWSLKGIK